MFVYLGFAIDEQRSIIDQTTTTMKNPIPKKTTIRKGRTQPKRTQSKSIPPPIDETAPLVDAPLTFKNATDQNELWMQLIPIFNEYQKYCVNQAAAELLDDENGNDIHQTLYFEKIQFRSGLLQKLFSAIHMNEIIAKLDHCSIADDIESSNETGNESVCLSWIGTSFTQALDYAVASLLTRDATSINKGASNTGSTSSSTSGSVACTAIFEFIVWASIVMLVPLNKSFSSPKPIDDLDPIGIGCFQSICLPVLSHICKFAECSVDAVRVVAVRSLCTFAECLGSTSSIDPSLEERLIMLDTIQQALLPRFTDKSISVRCAVVQACFPLAFQLSNRDNPLRTDPDILQALQWIVQHDPSPNNRITAIQHAPIDRSTMEYIIPRIRDTKVGARTAVIASISNAIPPAKTSDEPYNFLLPSRHIADIVTAGYTDRYVLKSSSVPFGSSLNPSGSSHFFPCTSCSVTKEATRRMICTSWIKSSNFNPITLLKWVNVMENTSVASSILEIWLEAARSSPTWLQDFSDNEQRSFQLGLHDAVAHFSISDIDVSNTATIDVVVRRLFIARNLLKFTISAHEKESFWSKLVPDISVLCQVLETVVSQLVNVLAANADEKEGEAYYGEKLIFICQELLLIATIDVGTSANQLEEGSRRILLGTIKNLLSNVVTPDDLLEGCVSALKELCASSVDNRFSALLSEIFPVVDRLSDVATSSDNELYSVHASIRILSLFTLVLETQESTEPLPTDILPNLMKHIRPAISHPNVLLRQAAVRTMGLFGSMIMGTQGTLSDDDFTSTLLSVATNVDEGLEIRIQAMLALTDWSILHLRDEQFFVKKHRVFVSLCDQVEGILNAALNEFSSGTVCCVAEMATKLVVFFMIRGPTNDSFYQEKCRSWLARLVMFYFDPKRFDDEDECDDVHQIGNPVRLQQFLSSFFLAMTSTRPFMTASGYLLDAIGPVLEMLLEQQIRIAEASGKAKVSAADALLWTRCVDFMVSTVVSCQEALSRDEKQPQSVSDVSRPVSPDSGSTESPVEESDVLVEDVAASSPYLVASIQVARFLSNDCSKIHVAYRRGLSKSIASMMINIDISNEEWKDLFCLKELLEELVENDGIDDAPCRLTLSPALQVLIDVESDACSENEDDDDVVSLSNDLENISIVPLGSENVSSLAAGTNIAKSQEDRMDTFRLARRLRTSN